MMTPIVNGIRSDYRQQLNVVYACLDEEGGRDIAKQHEIEGYPVVLLLDTEGRSVNIIRGVYPPAVLKQAVDDMLAER